MKLKGRRQSKNVEDIRDQKPSLGMAVGKVRGTVIGDVSLPQMGASQVSKTPNDPDVSINYDEKGVKMAKKVGMHKMEDAAERDSAANEKRRANQEEIESDLDRAFSSGNRLMGKPKQLKEIWTPRPLK